MKTIHLVKVLGSGRGFPVPIIAFEDPTDAEKYVKGRNEVGGDFYYFESLDFSPHVSEKTSPREDLCVEAPEWAKGDHMLLTDSGRSWCQWCGWTSSDDAVVKLEAK